MRSLTAICGPSDRRTWQYRPQDWFFPAQKQAQSFPVGSTRIHRPSTGSVGAKWPSIGFAVDNRELGRRRRVGPVMPRGLFHWISMWWLRSRLAICGGSEAAPSRYANPLARRVVDHRDSPRGNFNREEVRAYRQGEVNSNECCQVVDLECMLRNKAPYIPTSPGATGASEKMKGSISLNNNHVLGLLGSRPSSGVPDTSVYVLLMGIGGINISNETLCGVNSSA
jgi:hypothetical protein